MYVFRILAHAIVCLSLTLTACDDGEETPAPDATTTDRGVDSVELDVAADVTETDVPEEETEGSVRFDLEAAQAGDFFAYPYPSNLRVTESGAPDLSAFPTDAARLDLLTPSIAIIEAEQVGFSPLSPAYFSFNASLDPTTLPGETADTVAADASVFIIDVTVGSPTYGQLAPSTFVYNDEGGGYWPAKTLAIHPLYELPLRTGTTYAAVVTTAVGNADGTELEVPTVIARLGQSGGEMAEYFQPLVDAYADLGLDLDTIVAATVFTTSQPMAQMTAVRAWMLENLPEPEAADLEHTGGRPLYDIYEGTYPSEEFFSGVSPYRNFGDGIIATDENGEPDVRVPIDLKFAVSVPKGDMPADGWPMVLYGHGLGEDYRGFLRSAAGPLAERGIAVLGINPPLQGDRNPTSQDDRSLIITLSISNIIVGREILRHGVFDEIQALRLVQNGLTIPSDVSVDDTEIRFDADIIGFMGHSEGAQIGALLLAVEPGIGPALFSEGGGGAAITMFALELPEIDVGDTVADALGINPAVETFNNDHPVVGVVVQPLLDCADPLHGARNIFLEPIDERPHDLLMLEGFNDVLTPPEAIEALASALGLPIAEPVARSITGLDLQGVSSVSLPASENLPEVAGVRPTGALLQFPDDDHYIIYTNDAAKTQVYDFLESAVKGAGTIPDWGE